jgi:hypothetical protein
MRSRGFHLSERNAFVPLPEFHKVASGSGSLCLRSVWLCRSETGGVGMVICSSFCTFPSLCGGGCVENKGTGQRGCRPAPHPPLCLDFYGLDALSQGDYVCNFQTIPTGHKEVVDPSGS